MNVGSSMMLAEKGMKLITANVHFFETPLKSEKGLVVFLYLLLLSLLAACRGGSGTLLFIGQLLLF